MIVPEEGQHTFESIQVEIPQSIMLRSCEAEYDADHSHVVPLECGIRVINCKRCSKLFHGLLESVCSQFVDHLRDVVSIYGLAEI
ncbi:hypothetical protein CgunFtcFv8_013900 [Champsocephalus gunnari]|uniref:Uncharacterized protein n=1 Tax=Champsocephalus gunnari TaxID=52237 RepID=A0AAN8E460_CHAGU|nr:hypothetical protein CgunFtcFv8_013900 [Champsocephalus gunnari]